MEVKRQKPRTTETFAAEADIGFALAILCEERTASAVKRYRPGRQQDRPRRSFDCPALCQTLRTEENGGVRTKYVKKFDGLVSSAFQSGCRFGVKDLALASTSPRWFGEMVAYNVLMERACRQPSQRLLQLQTTPESIEHTEYLGMLPKTTADDSIRLTLLRSQRSGTAQKPSRLAASPHIILIRLP